jgi:ATP-binding cassette subfamily B protein
VAGVSQRIRARHEAAWRAAYRSLARQRWISAGWHTAAWLLFGAGFVGGVLLLSRSPGAAGDVALVLAAGSRLSAYVSQTASEAHFLRTIWVDVSRRMVWLEDFAASRRGRADVPVPDRVTEGIALHDVSFRYPGAPRPALEHVDLLLPAGRVVAVVGENGAGKSTLIKLLCRYYDPTGGRITVDGQPLERMPPDRWRARLAGAFQDFVRFEYPAWLSVGLGDHARREDAGAVAAALARAGAQDLVDSLPAGPDTQLGGTWPDGVDLSIGQWQKFALARGFMRPEPLLLVLDEPTSALDAETEHALFERYAAAAQDVDGQITVLVSHRFSTVRMADLIVVLDGAHVAEQGTHEHLMANGGKYAELYGIQAASYR